jgi:hypothetical protein
MFYTALVNSKTLMMSSKKTGDYFDAVAVIPGHAPDMAKLVNMLSPEEADELASIAAMRAIGGQVEVPQEC